MGLKFLLQLEVWGRSHYSGVGVKKTKVPGGVIWPHRWPGTEV